MKFIFCLVFLFCAQLKGIDRVVIWGHKLHTHTHSYVHYGFYKAFKAMGYETIWLDNSDEISEINLDNALFITEHQVDEKIPIRSDCYYAVHNSESNKYDYIKRINHYIDLKVYRSHFVDSDSLKEIEPLIFYDVTRGILIMPWATDLLPNEIEQNKMKTVFSREVEKEKKIYWVGTLGAGIGGNINEISPFIRACEDANVKFIHSDPWGCPISAESNIARIQESYLAPAICGTLQSQEGYIPCRIFKNISYGHLGMTNSKFVYDFFHRKIVYNSDSYQLFFDGEKKLQEKNLAEIHELMDFIKEKHTYLNRASHLLRFIQYLDESRDVADSM